MPIEVQHPVAFVPTMGALHAGHESLITLAKNNCDNVLVSIFVNPLQFESPEDLEKYPRSLERDTERALLAGATHVWAPSVSEIYPGPVAPIDSGELGSRFEGVHRVGHFDGMLTVVHRLFDLVQPQYAIFGEKDFQQLFLVKQMVRRLSLPVKIIAAPIIREADGLAMSSRNVRLGDAGHRAALAIYRALKGASAEPSLESARRKLHQLLAEEAAFTLDYAEIIDESNFEIAQNEKTKNRAIVAGWINGVRLLDNMAIAAGQE